MVVFGVNSLKVYVMGGYDLSGGCYMAYHIGRICHEYSGLSVRVVGSKRHHPAYFNYPYDFPVITVAEMEHEIMDEDIFICNPSFSKNMFGLRISGKKVCYVQGTATFIALDAFFDTYVFVSHFVKDFILRYYGIQGPIINAFIEVEIFNKGKKWEERKDSVMVFFHKDIILHLFKKFEAIYRRKYPSSPIHFETYRNLNHRELAEIMGSHKYYLALSPVEGFGLPALEAMASGCAIAGFDAWGGKDYFKHNINAMVTDYPGIETVADYLFEITQNERKARQLAENAHIDAQYFNKKRYDDQWTDILKELVGKNL